MKYYLVAALPSPYIVYGEDGEKVNCDYLIDIDRVTAYTISQALKNAANKALADRSDLALTIVPYCVHWSYIGNNSAIDDKRLTEDVTSGKVRLLDNFIYRLSNQ